MTSYLLEVSLCLSIFYLLYYFWLSKETFFHLNRWYLLGTLFLGLLIPFLPSPLSSGAQESEWINLYVAPISLGLESLEITVTAPVEMEKHFDWWALLYWIYWAGIAITSFRFLSGLWRIGSLYFNAKHIKVGNFSVALTKEAHLPFSFFRVIFKSELGSFNAFEEEKITDHELAHVRGWHTIDVLLVELVSIFLWCSPLVYLYRRSLRIVHEYIADSAAIRPGQKKQYGHLLIRQSQSGLQLALANHFIQSQLKKRIMMITKTRSRRQAFLKYLPVIPLLVVALVIFSNWEVAANDPLNALTENAIEHFEVMPPVAAEDFDPKVLQKKLSAILHKREKSSTNVDPKLAREFASVHDEWAAKYPEHKTEIRKIAMAVAEQYELIVSFENNIMNSAYFKHPFEPNKEVVDQPLSMDKISLHATEGDESKEPYVVIDNKPAPADWKANLDPNEIERIDVLKGEAAIEKYGEDGANGVVMITTKTRLYDTMPIFPGCENLKGEEQSNCSTKSFLTSIYKNIKYPMTAREQRIEGTILVKYTIGKNGQLQAPHILQGIGGGCDEEVLRVIQEMPTDWIPAKKAGKAIAVDLVLPIKYVLEGDQPTPKRLDKEEKPKMNNVVVNEKVVVVGYPTTRPKRAALKEVDEMPSFPGCEEETDAKQRKHCGQKKMLTFIYTNLKYPKEAARAGLEGTVISSFVVAKDGSIKDVRIERGLGHGINEEVLKVVGEMPAWIPGRKDGKAVDAIVTLPVKFMLEKEDKTKEKKKPTTVHVNGPSTEMPANTLTVENYKVAPNPTDGRVNLRFLAEAAPLSINILSPNGQVVYQQEWPQFNGNFDEQINLQDAPRGTLFLRIQQGEKIHTTTLILQ